MSRSSSEFLKTTIIGGLVVIVPVAVLALVLGDLFRNLVSLADPIASQLPFGTLVNTAIVTLLALFVILLLCFVTGMIVRTSWGHAGRQWFERRILGRVPMYDLVRNLTHQFAGSNSTQFIPAEIDLYGSECTVLGAIVDELPDGRLAVFVPATPVATVGQVHLVPAARVKKLDASLAAAVNSIAEWGSGTSALFGASEKTGPTSA